MSLSLFSALIMIGCLTALYLVSKTFAARARLEALEQSRPDDTDDFSQEISWAQSNSALASIKDRLGRAGFITPDERKRAKLLQGAIIILPALIGAFAWKDHARAGALIGFGVGGYVGITAWMQLLGYCTKTQTRKVLFHIPLFLESIILLVESGLGILPAIEKSVGKQEPGKTNPVRRMMRLVYELSAHGIPFSDALQAVADASSIKVLRHTLLHLDISGTEGGELIPSLRSLSAHAHHEWKLSVEQRVKRLENLVVFPVFASVLGLMLLTAAVPIVPVIKLSQSLGSGGNNLQAVMQNPNQPNQ